MPKKKKVSNIIAWISIALGLIAISLIILKVIGVF